MIKVSELKDLGKHLSSSYLDDSMDMTEGLQKIATQKGLNQEQVNRIAEVANVETYLQMMKTAEDTYIEFPIANPTDVEVSKDKPTVKKASTSDFDAPPAYEISDDNFYKVAGIQKEGEEGVDEAAMYKQALKLQDTVTYLQNRLQDTLFDYETTVHQLNGHVKQALLQDTNINDVYEVVSQAAPNSSDHFWESTLDKLSSLGIPTDSFDPDQNTGRLVNEDSDIYKIASKAEERMQKSAKTINAIEHYHNELEEVDVFKNLDDPLEKMAGVFMDTAGFIKRYPKFSAGSGAAFLANRAGKKRGRREQGEILQKHLTGNRQNQRR